MDTHRNDNQTRSRTIEGALFNDPYLPDSLAAALQYAGEEGFLASTPDMIDVKLIHPLSHPVWSKWFTTSSEEYNGKTRSGKPVVLEVHGGGILTQLQRLEKAYEEGITKEFGARLDDQEVLDAIYGKLPGGITLPIYTLAEIRRGINPEERRFGVIMDYSTARDTRSGFFTVDELIKNPIAIARAGSIKRLEDYAIKATTKYNAQKLGLTHPFNKISPDEPQARFLIMGISWEDCFDSGLQYSEGAFVGVQVRTKDSLQRQENTITPPPNISVSQAARLRQQYQESRN
jgi:hypothetical protein